MPGDCPFQCNLSEMLSISIRDCFNLECQFDIWCFLIKQEGTFDSLQQQNQNWVLLFEGWGKSLGIFRIAVVLLNRGTKRRTRCLVFNYEFQKFILEEYLMIALCLHLSKNPFYSRKLPPANCFGMLFISASESLEYNWGFFFQDSQDIHPIHTL